MSAADRARYLRNGEVLWRDSGQHVLLLRREARTEVTLLGGGGAALWRLLGQRRTLAEIRASFADQHGQVPADAEMAATLHDLVTRGLITVEAAAP